MGLSCKIGFHKFKKTNEVEKIAVFDKPNSWEYMTKYVCSCGKEEWREIDE